MLIDLAGPGPINHKIYQAIRADILGGKLRAGARLPSSRALSLELCVSRNVVLIAYENLMAEGYLESRHGSGTYVASIDELPAHSKYPPKRAELSSAPRLSDYAHRLGVTILEPLYESDRGGAKIRYDFRYGHPASDLIVRRTWRRLSIRHAADIPVLETGYGPPEGNPSLRTAVAQYLRESRGVECEPAQVIIVNGSQQALDLTTRVLVNPGDTVALEEPCYPGMRQALMGAGAKIHPLPVDEEGVVTGELANMAAPPRLICVTPSHQYPTGSILSLSRRLALVAYARETGAFVLEDDYDSEFRYSARVEKSIQGIDRSGRVIYVGTFSKVLFPALRIGYLVLPAPLLPSFTVAKAVTDRFTSPFLQKILADFISEGHFGRHLRRVRKQVGERRRALLESFEEELPGETEVSGESAGVHVLMRFPRLSSKKLQEIAQRATGLGVAVYPVDPCYASPPRVPGLVIGYASMPKRQIREGVRRFARAFKRSE